MMVKKKLAEKYKQQDDKKLKSLKFQQFLAKNKSIENNSKFSGLEMKRMSTVL